MAVFVLDTRKKPMKNHPLKKYDGHLIVYHIHDEQHLGFAKLSHITDNPQHHAILFFYDVSNTSFQQHLPRSIICNTDGIAHDFGKWSVFLQSHPFKKWTTLLNIETSLEALSEISIVRMYLAAIGKISSPLNPCDIAEITQHFTKNTHLPSKLCQTLLQWTLYCDAQAQQYHKNRLYLATILLTKNSID